MKRDPINPSKSPFIKGRLLISPLWKRGVRGDLGLILMCTQLWTKCEGKVEDVRAISGR